MLTFNDRAAMGLLDALIRARVDVPGAVSVVGYDDSPFSRLAHVDLTTVSQNTPELTEHAIAAVIERLDGGRTGHREVVVRPRVEGAGNDRAATRPPVLISRATTTRSVRIQIISCAKSHMPDGSPRRDPVIEVLPAGVGPACRAEMGDA